MSPFLFSQPVPHTTGWGEIPVDLCSPQSCFLSSMCHCLILSHKLLCHAPLGVSIFLVIGWGKLSPLPLGSYWPGLYEWLKSLNFCIRIEDVSSHAWPPITIIVSGSLSIALPLWANVMFKWPKHLKTGNMWYILCIPLCHPLRNILDTDKQFHHAIVCSLLYCATDCYGAHLIVAHNFEIVSITLAQFWMASY